MKQLLLTATIFICVWTISPCSAQTYKVDEKRIYSWDDNSTPADWQQDLTENYIYGNEGNKETNLLAKQFPSMSNLYQNNKTYNSSNYIIMDVRQFWNPSTMAWINTLQTLYDYDGANNVTEEIFQSYNQITMVYVNSSRVLYTYLSGNLASETEQQWNPGTDTWINDSRDLYEYTGSDIIKFTEQTWNAGMDNWVNVEKTEITYASPDKPIQGIISEWNTVTSMWEVEERDTATYNAMDLLEEVLFELYDGSDWETDGRVQFMYSNGLQTEALNQEWDGANWINEDRELSTYDGNGNKTVYIFESWDADAMTWEGDYKEEFDFSEALPFSLSTESFNKNDFKVFPNPTTNNINISTKEKIDYIALYSILGNVVLKENKTTNKLDVSTLNPGIYLLNIYSGNKKVVKKVIVN